MLQSAAPGAAGVVLSGSSASLVSARSLRVGHAGRAVLPALDLEIRRGEFWVLVGRNGSGKTTLLRTLVGLLPPVAGEVTAGCRTTGYVPQRTTVDVTVPSRVIDLVAEGAELGWSFLRPWLRREARAAIERAVNSTSIATLLHRPFASLSEGQKQRVLIARAIACSPDLLVLDEPTSAMDHHAEQAVFELLDGLRADFGLTIVLVTHHLNPATERATHAAFVDADDAIACVSPWSAVREHPAFRQRYGSVVPTTTPEVEAHATHTREGSR